MGILNQIGRFVGNILELLAIAIAGLIAVAIWAIGVFIDLTTDIFNWINNKLESLLNADADNVRVIDGSSLGRWLEENKNNYTEVTMEQINAMKNSVVNVAMGKQGNIIDDQMIRSQGGLSAQTRERFKGNPILKIRLS